MSRKRRDRSWPPVDAVVPLAAPVIDNHTHLPVPGLPVEGPGSEAPLDSAELVARAAAAGISGVITSACETPGWEGSIELARSLSAVRVALAVHPNEAVLHAGVREVGPDGLDPDIRPHHAEPLDEAMARLEHLVRANRDVVVAVGETGLDFFRTGPRGAAAQREAFRAHIALAKEAGLPLQIHDRDAHEDCVRTLLADGAPERTVFHCFSGGPARARAGGEPGGDAAGAGNATRSGPSHEGGKWNTWCVSVSLGMPGLRPELNVLSARKKTRQITVGDVAVGGDAPISVQSMTTTKTHDIGATLQQIAELTAAGCDIVRVACPTDKDASALPVIAKQSRIPVIADIHFQPRYVFAAIEAGCGAVRVNPGNIRKFDDKVADICKAAADHGTSLRIGVNAGSLDPRLLRKYGSATPEALVESAVWEASLFEECGFHDFKISVKHHDVVTMVQAYRMLSERGDWPLHLGVTEAGPAFQGTIKSAAAFGALLAEGVGDTIRVSLSAPPVEEVKVGSKLLEFMGLRPRKLEIVSCPSCGRAQVDVWTLAESVEEGLKGIAAPLRVAVMGCVVNGPGEAREADLGCASGNGKGKIFVRGEVVATVPEDQIVETLLRFAADMAEEMGTPEDGATGPIVETY